MMDVLREGENIKETKLRLVKKPPVAVINNLGKSFGSKRALDGINLNIPEGRIIGLLGKNGSGKTTLLKILSGFCTGYEGSVTIDGFTPGSSECKKIVAYLPDKEGLPENMTAGQAIEIYGEFFDDFDKERCISILKNFGIKETQTPKEMSKGETDKLQIALMMARNARMYLLDEPIGGVDAEARQQVLDLILENFNPEGTMIIVTHLIKDIERLFDSVIVLKEGKVQAYEDADSLRESEGGTLEDAVISIFRGEKP